MPLVRQEFGKRKTAKDPQPRRYDTRPAAARQTEKLFPRFPDQVSIKIWVLAILLNEYELREQRNKVL
jgi:hypothetical protein